MQVEARAAAAGDVLFREQLPHAVVYVAHVDLRSDGAAQVVACLASGEVRGYSSAHALSAVLQAHKDVEALEQVWAHLIIESEFVRWWICVCWLSRSLARRTRRWKHWSRCGRI